MHFIDRVIKADILDLRDLENKKVLSRAFRYFARNNPRLDISVSKLKPIIRSVSKEQQDAIFELLKEHLLTD